MSKVRFIASLLLVLFLPFILIVATKWMHTIYVWLLTGIAPSQEVQYLATLLTTVSFVAAGVYAFWRWMDE